MRRFVPARRGPLVRLAMLVAVGPLALVGLAGLAGCTSIDHGSSTPTAVHPGTAATSTATPSANPTDVAAAAALAAVRKLYAELNSAISTGSTAAYRETFTRECGICVHDARVVDQIYKRGEHIVGGTYHVASLLVVWNKPDLVIVQGLLSATALTVRKGSQIIEKDRALRPFSFTWKVKPVGPHWLITEVHALA